MNLEQFIQETLVAIAHGIKTANKTEGVAFWMHGEKEVEFDVAVTVQEQNGKSGGAGIKVLSLGLGYEQNKDSSTSAVTRIRFKVRPQNTVM